MKIPPFRLTTWRVIKNKPANGAWNMAVDEAILGSIQSGKSKPALRMFAWYPPCLSLGYAQPFSDIDLDRLSTMGWDAVRRITGGRAILHTDELTYSVIGPDNEPRLQGGVLESYRCLSAALLSALRMMGLPAQVVPKPSTSDQNKQDHQPVCFETPSNYEITFSGRKLIGSAQARKKSTVLQHGTIPLYGDITRIIDVLKFPDNDSRQNAKNKLLLRATTVETELKKRISWEQSASVLIQAFSKTLNISFEDSGLTQAELDQTEFLVKEKYAHPSWTARI
jgi:lipoate-protein ligase A